MLRANQFFAAFVLGAVASKSCGGSATAPTAMPTVPSPAHARAMPMVVEPNFRNTFGPPVIVPANTTMYLGNVTNVPGADYRLQLCGTPCNIASTIQVWPTGTFVAGDVLSQVTGAGEYYIWSQDVSTGSPVPSTADEAHLNARRITLANGAVVDAWYVLP